MGAGWTEVLKASTNVCVLVYLESAACLPASVNFSLYQLERRKGALVISVCFT